ncbi:hypothetical protein Kuura_040 [Caulobacter phage Kuura]|nr:hypothetical protein Kuura_040 [Caulobacter phage Kuura]
MLETVEFVEDSAKVGHELVVAYAVNSETINNVDEFALGDAPEPFFSPA